MKKFLTMVVALILLFSVCSSCRSIKEAEYKAKVKEELDSIPIEETGYKLIFNNDSNTWLNRNECNLEIDGHTYEFADTEKDFLIVYIDDAQKNTPIKINCSYEENFKKYIRFFGCYYFDNRIFIIKYSEDAADNCMSKNEDFLPPLLFLFNPNDQTVKYCGYFEKWFEGHIWDYKNYFSIIKT